MKSIKYSISSKNVKRKKNYIFFGIAKDSWNGIESCSLSAGFAVIKEDYEKVMLLCDYIRSIPLFYCVIENEILVSDNAELIKKETKSNWIEDNVNEFLKTGYVTENETLFKDIYQVGPGECIYIYKERDRIECHPYFECNYKMDSLDGKDSLIHKFDYCLQEVFQEMIERLHGRTALIPLSGGCDSRTIAVMLKRMGYKNVICFSYGRLGNEESALSEKIAKTLGFSWHFIEYSKEVWKEFYDSADYIEYLKFSCRGSGIGCLQPLPAVLKLKRETLVPKDAIVIPGHALDFVAGSHLLEFEENQIYTRRQLTDFIQREHYNLHFTINCEAALKKWTKNLKEKFTRKEVICEYQKWEWKNRQSKFIANDVRAYEFAGFEWELPFWDRRVCEFWEKVPEKYLIKRYLQYEYTRKMIDPIAGISLGYYHSKKKMEWKRKLKQVLKKAMPFLYILKQYYYCYYQHYHNGNAFFDFIEDSEYKKYRKKFGYKFSINSIEADRYIQELRKQENSRERFR